MSIELVPVGEGGALPESTPSLMPFDISYNGPAPVSLYFRPKPAPCSLSISSTRFSSLTTLVASSLNSQLNESDTRLDDTTSTPPHEASVMDVNSGTQPISTPVPCDNSSASTLVTVTPPSPNVERFVAAFRGRQMYGQAVEIPRGYGGLVLRTPEEAKGKAKDDAIIKSLSSQETDTKPKTRGKTPQSRRATDIDVTNDIEGDGNDGGDSPGTSLPTRSLIPTSTFSSFTLWTADIPLDEGRDEYVRALMEWTRLAAEIHSNNDDSGLS